MKKHVILVFLSCLVLLLSSCLGSDDKYDYDVVKNCQIVSFTLKHDSISGLSAVAFTIDQVNGRIFNQDSLPYGTEVDKVVATVTYGSTISVGSVQVAQEAVGDTIHWNGSDSLDYSKPVKFIVTAYDGEIKKAYDTRLNIHQVVPDSMVWSKLAVSLPGNGVTERKVISFGTAEAELYSMYTKETDGYHLYTSQTAEASEWTAKSLTGFPTGAVRLEQLTVYEDVLYIPATDQKLYRSGDGITWAPVETAPAIVALLGVVSEETTAKLPSALAAVASVNNTPRFVSMNKAGTWQEGTDVSSDFPVSGFSALSYSLMYRERLLVAGGKNTSEAVKADVWSTMDGINWVLLTSDASFGEREGASVALYDTTFFMIGGLDAKGVALKDIYRSKDNGFSWILSDTLTVMPVDYSARGYASMIVDEKTNYIYLFGGKDGKGTKDTGELWRGRINRLGFKK